MKASRKIVLGVLLLPVVLVLVSFFLPSHYQVQRAVTMQTTPDKVFPWINELKRWTEWSAWTEARYPGMKTTYTGPASGTGAAMSWEGKKSGQGTLQITSSDPAKGLTYDLDFEHGAYRSKGAISFQPSGSSLVVTWSNGGDLGWNPVSRYFGLFMDSMMGPDMEAGLKSLQAKVEAK